MVRARSRSRVSELPGWNQIRLAWGRLPQPREWCSPEGGGKAFVGSPSHARNSEDGIVVEVTHVLRRPEPATLKLVQEEFRKSKVRKVHGRLKVLDRGLVDAMAALNDATGAPISREIVDRYPFYREVFLTPPWPEIYQVDPERRHDFDLAVAEYQRLLIIYPELDFRIRVLPRLLVEERATFLLDCLQEGTG